MLICLDTFGKDHTIHLWAVDSGNSYLCLLRVPGSGLQGAVAGMVVEWLDLECALPYTGGAQCLGSFSCISIE